MEIKSSLNIKHNVNIRFEVTEYRNQHKLYYNQKMSTPRDILYMETPVAVNGEKCQYQIEDEAGY